jgi:outer membrane protein
MTKLSTGLFLILFCSNAFAQTKKGNFALSGKTDLNFLFSKNQVKMDSVKFAGSKTNQFGISAGMGYFVADNFMVGVSGTYSYIYSNMENVNNQYGSQNITTTLGIVPQVTYYFPMDGKLRPSVSAGAGYVWLRERDSRVTDNNNLANSLSGVSLTGAAGISYFINQSVSFDFGMQYTRNRLENKLQTNQILIQNMVAGNIGVTVFF